MLTVPQALATAIWTIAFVAAVVRRATGHNLWESV